MTQLEVTHWGKHNLEGVSFLIENNDDLIVPFHVTCHETCPHKGLSLEKVLEWPKRVFVETYKDLASLTREYEQGLDIDFDRTFLYSDNINRARLELLMRLTNAYPVFISEMIATETKDNELLRYLAYQELPRPVVIGGDPYFPLPRGFVRMTENQFKHFLKEKKDVRVKR